MVRPAVVAINGNTRSTACATNLRINKLTNLRLENSIENAADHRIACTPSLAGVIRTLRHCHRKWGRYKPPR